MKSNGISAGSRTNASNNGMSGRLITDGQKTNAAYEKNTTVGDNEVMFEGTFKPQTHLVYPPAAAEEGGMPFGTFGGFGGQLPPAERPSYNGDDAHSGNSFYNPGREISMKEVRQ